MYEEHFYKNPFSGEEYPQSIYQNTPSSELKSIGRKDILRIDAKDKVIGAAKFSNDIILPGMLYLKWKLCPHSRAKIKSIDTSKAKALPGVVMVLTHDDIPDLVDHAPYEFVLNNEVFHDGCEVAAVLAEEEDIAEEAIDLIDIQYDVSDIVLWADDALESGAPVLHGDTNEDRTYEAKRGDVEAGFSQSDIVVGPVTYGITKPTWQEQRDTADIEGDTHTAYWDGERVNLWTYEKNKFGPHRTTAAALGLSYNQVNVPWSYLGTCFGGNRGGNFKGGILVSYLAMKTGRPVKTKYESQQNINAKGNQNSVHLTMKAGIKNDGSLNAVSITNIFDSGCLGGKTPSGHEVVRKMWNVPNLYLNGTSATTNGNPDGSIRCVAHPRPTMLVGMFIDKVAEAAGMDPADFLLKNVLTTSGPGGDLDNPKNDACTNAMPEMLNKLVEVSGWKSKWKGWKTPLSVNGPKKRGIGIAYHRCSHGSLSNPESAILRVERDGTFTLVCGSMDVGQGWRTAGTLIAAEELGVPAESVVGARFETGSTQESRGPSGSTITRGSGTAVILAARDAKEGIFKAAIAGGFVEGATKPEDLEMADGNIYLKSNPDTKVPLSDVTARMTSLVGPIIGRGYYATNRQNRITYQWSSAVAEVEVDTDTGEVQVINVWHFADTGRTIWYKGFVNQALGAIEMSCGRALYEGMVKDVATGATLNANYLDQKIATQMDSPNSSTNFHETIDYFGPVGAKGIAEPMVGAPAPAVINAIYNACGVRATFGPVTPDIILAGLGKA